MGSQRHHRPAKPDPHDWSNDTWLNPLPVPEVEEGGASMLEAWHEAARELDAAFAPTEPSGQAPLSVDTRAPAPAPRNEPSITVTPSQTATSSEASMTVPVDVAIPFKLAKQNVISEFERRYISRLLAQHDGNISAAARAAGIDRMSIHKMRHRLGLANPGRD